MGCLRGFSGAIFAYGQTNSGKTWTVTGGESFEERGIAPRAIGLLFREIRNAEIAGLPVRYEVSRDPNTPKVWRPQNTSTSGILPVCDAVCLFFLAR